MCVCVREGGRKSVAISSNSSLLSLPRRWTINLSVFPSRASIAAVTFFTADHTHGMHSSVAAPPSSLFQLGERRRQTDSCQHSERRSENGLRVTVLACSLSLPPSLPPSRLISGETNVRDSRKCFPGSPLLCPFLHLCVRVAIQRGRGCGT